MTDEQREDPRWSEELRFATRIAREAGQLTLRWFRTATSDGPGVEDKADGSPVTTADREAERLLRRRIAERYPADGVLGEEDGEESGRSGRRWILDPIDGTRSFIHGVPLYGIMVALEDQGRVVVGVLHFPALAETVAAASGLGCLWNGRPAAVSTMDRLDRALVLTSGDILTGDPAISASDGSAAARAADLARLAGRAGTFRTWGDCYGYALVATGRAEAMLDPSLNTWDAAAVRPIIEEAGGVFTDWDGKATHESGHAVATNAALTDAVQRVLSDRSMA